MAKDRCHGPAEGVCVASYDASISNPESPIQNLKSQIEDRRATALLWLLIVVCLACDFLMMPLLAALRGPLGISAIPLYMAVLGCVLAQGNLLAAWLAWNDQPFWQRFARHWLIAAVLFLVWANGVVASQINSSDTLLSFIAFVGLTVPLVSIAAQTPLWIARQVFGWRLVRDEEKTIHGDAKNANSPAPLSIRDLMLATVLVAASLTLARLAPSPDGKGLEFIWIVMFAVAGLISTLTVLPAAPLLLRTHPFQRGLLFASLYAAFWVGMIWLVVLIARYRGLFSLPPAAILVGASGLILSFAATVILASAAVRARGYSLASGRSPRRHATRSSSLDILNSSGDKT